MANGLLQLVYVSSASDQFPEADLLVMLDSFRAANRVREVSGIMLYKGGNIMQVLEGESSTVRKLFASINGDDRHKDVLVLLEEPIETRSFPDWSMSFRKLSNGEHEGFSSFLTEITSESSHEIRSTKTKALIELFRDSM